MTDNELPDTRAEPVRTPQTGAEVIIVFNERWGSGDIDGTLDLLDEDCIYTLHISEDLLPVGGETRGKAAIGAALRQLRRDYHYMMYHGFNQVSDGDIVRQQVHFMYRHRASGEVLRGTFRIHFVVSNGRITRAEEYHDRAMVEAFLRLYGS